MTAPDFGIGRLKQQCLRLFGKASKASLPGAVVGNQGSQFANIDPGGVEFKIQYLLNVNACDSCKANAYPMRAPSLAPDKRYASWQSWHPKIAYKGNESRRRLGELRWVYFNKPNYQIRGLTATVEAGPN